MISGDIIAYGIGVASVVTVAITASEFGYESLRPPNISGSATWETTVEPGQTIPLVWKLVKLEDCPGEFSRVWDQPSGYYYSELSRMVGLPTMLEPTLRLIPTQIPETVLDGELRLRVIGYFDCPNRSREDFILGPVFFEVVSTEDNKP